MISDSRLIELQNQADRQGKSEVPGCVPFSAYLRARDRALYNLMHAELCVDPEHKARAANVLEAEYIRGVNAERQRIQRRLGLGGVLPVKANPDGDS